MNQIIIILHQPQDERNIGAVVRAMKNMGLHRLRLVAPVAYQPADLLRIAHRSEAVLDAIEHFADLPSALADVHYVVGSSERSHPEHPMAYDARALAPQLLSRAQNGLVALLFGPEDHGLDRTALDCCHLILRLPTDPSYPSLNLAQAVLLTLYELRMAAHGPLPPPPPRTPAPGAAHATLAQLLTATMAASGFVKAGDGTTSLHRLRRLLIRAEPDATELALLNALLRQILSALRYNTP
ncbi:MAG: rRNA methyltransferase [Candidatus Viridilinea halotolerans]|uniref:rRNA methyltransferase n=1 Tax=Candidatus Viridilinea halotolerans TaxID=2491704 RepID=A0A426UBN8_9CHLR|nr:MAG: rRNA methyltransferase [Candidatus Viridilinea halotolerans]